MEDPKQQYTIQLTNYIKVKEIQFEPDKSNKKIFPIHKKQFTMKEWPLYQPHGLYAECSIPRIPL